MEKTNDITVSHFMRMCDGLERSKDTSKHKKLDKDVYVYTMNNVLGEFNKSTIRVAKWLVKHHSDILNKSLVASGNTLLFAVSTAKSDMSVKLDTVTKLIVDIKKKRGVTESLLIAMDYVEGDTHRWLIAVDMNEKE